MLSNSCQYEAIPGFPFFDINELAFEASIDRNSSPVFLYRDKDGKPYAVK